MSDLLVCVLACVRVPSSITGSLVLLLLKESEDDRKAPERLKICWNSSVQGEDMRDYDIWESAWSSSSSQTERARRQLREVTKTPVTKLRASDKETSVAQVPHHCKWKRHEEKLNIHQNCRGHLRSPRRFISPEDGGGRGSRSLKAWKS